MKEKVISEKKIIKTLTKDRYMVINPICKNCLHEVIQLVLDNFEAYEVKFEIQYMAYDFYRLTINMLNI